MKIICVTHALYPYVIGGLPIHCHKLYNYMSKTGHQITILTVKYGNKIEEATCNYDLEQFKYPKMPWDLLNLENPICPGLWWKLLKFDFDLLHCHSHLFFISLLSIIICKIRNKPSVITVHGVRAIRDEVTNLFQEVWLRTVSRLIFKITDKIICLTHTDAKAIKKYGAKEKKIEIIPNGVNTDLFSYCTSHNDYILWVGRFVEEKGLKYLVEAIEKIVKDIPNKRVVLVGEGPLKQEIINKVDKAELSNMFEFIENLSLKEIAKIIKNCELFVFPSLREGFPNVLSEAMSCGKPIITTRELKEIVNGAGILVEPANAEELAEAIKKILSNSSERENMGLKGRRFAVQYLSWDIVGDKTEKVYNSMINGE